MTPPATPPWKLPAALAAALLVGATLGWLAGGHVAAGVALVAVAEVVLLLTRIRHQAQAMIAAPAVVRPLQHDRFMARSRRIASNLRERRPAASTLQDVGVLLESPQRYRWFNNGGRNVASAGR